MWPCVVGDLWHRCCSAYMPMNIANSQRISPSTHLVACLDQLSSLGMDRPSSSPFLPLYLHPLYVSSPLLVLGRKQSLGDGPGGASDTVAGFVLEYATRFVAWRFHRECPAADLCACACACACVCVHISVSDLPSVMQKTLRKARSWAEMGGSLQCRAKTQDLKTTAYTPSYTSIHTPKKQEAKYNI